MKKLFTLLTMLILGISGMWGQTSTATCYVVNGRTSASDLKAGKKYMIWHSGEQQFIGVSESNYVNRQCKITSAYSTMNTNYIWELQTGTVSGTFKIKNVGTGLYCDGCGEGNYDSNQNGGNQLKNTTGKDYTIGDFANCPDKGTGLPSYADDGTQAYGSGNPINTINSAAKTVYIVENGKKGYWNWVENAFNTYKKSHVYVLYEVKEVIVPSGCNSYIGETKTISSEEWKEQSNWGCEDHVAQWNIDGPGCPSSNMWSPIYLKDITGGTVPKLEGWNFRMIADHSTYEIEEVGKIQYESGKESYLTLKNTSDVTMNFGTGHAYSLTVNLNEGTGNILNFVSKKDNYNNPITVNYGNVSKNTNRVFNASASSSKTISNLILNVTLTDPTEKNTVESISLATFSNITVTTLTPTISGTEGWTLVDSKAALETQTTNGKYYYVEQNSTSGVTLHTYLRSIYEVSASTTETLSEITDYETYGQFVVPSGSTLNVDVPGFDPSVIESEGTVNYIVTQETEALSTITGYDTYDGIMVPSGKTLNVDVQNFDPSIIEGEGTVNYIVTGESETLSEITSYSTYDGIIVPEGQTLSVDKPEFDMSKITGEGTIIRVQKKVTFSIAVAVNGGDAVSTIYVATDGSDEFTLPTGYTYTFGGTTYYTAKSAAAAIAAAGTDDISVTVASVITDLSDLSNNKK